MRAIPVRNYFGRTVLFTNEKEITADNIVSVLQSVLPDFQKNKEETEYLYNYFRGNQPILKRKKKVRPEINNRVVENHAHEIVSFKVGYEFGEPVQYVRRATNSGKELLEKPTALENEDMEVTSKIALLNEFMFQQDKATKDKDLAESFFVCGTAYRMVLPPEIEVPEGESPFEIDTLDARYTGIVYYKGFGKKPLMSIQEVEKADKTIVYYCYTNNTYYEITEDAITHSEGHLLGHIPIIEYPANNSRIGAFELVMSLLDQINNAESNRIDGIEQFIQAFMKFINVRIDKETFEELKEMGAIAFKSDPQTPADIDIVSSELNQQQVQTVIDHLYQMVLIICGMPDRNGTNRTTGDTGQAVILRDGWSAAAAKAKDTESMFKLSEKRFLKLVLKLVKDTEDIDIRLSDIDIKLRPCNTDNLLTKTQGLQNMLEAGIHPQIAITTCGLFGDPEQVYIDSLPYIRNKWKTKDEADADNPMLNENVDEDDKNKIVPANNKPNPIEE